jgi:GNAT superfamily N-acetyltransferase
MVTIRTTTLDDCAAIARVQVDSYRAAYAGIFPQEYLDGFTYEEQEQDWRELLSSGGEDIVPVAEADGAIAGYALGRPEPVGITPYDCELVALHVRRERQRQGVGGALAAAMADALRAKGCKSMMLWVLAKNPARRFYERLGGRAAPQDADRPRHGGGGLQVARHRHIACAG